MRRVIDIKQGTKGMGRTLAALALLASLSAFTACDDGNDGPIVAPPDTPPGEVAPAITSSATYKWSFPANAPTVNPACAPPDTGIYGGYVAWKGFIHDGTTYTCNACPGGREVWQGTWRGLAKDSDPTAPFPRPGYRDRLVINGNLFTFDTAEDGEGPHRVSGFYWSGDKAEVPNATTMFVVTSVSEEGGFDWYTGVLSSLVLLEQGVNELLTFWYFDVTTTGTSNYDASLPYCRVGSIVQTADGTEHACTDPFQ